MAYTRGEKLHGWYKTVNRCTIREVKSARDANRSREDNVLNYFIARSTNASAVSHGTLQVSQKVRIFVKTYIIGNEREQ